MTFLDKLMLTLAGINGGVAFFLDPALPMWFDAIGFVGIVIAIWKLWR